MIACQQIHQLELNAIGVLELVDQNVLPAPLVILENSRKLFKEFNRLHQKIAKIQSIGVEQHSLIDAVEASRKFIVNVVGRRSGLGGENARVLPLVDAPTNPLGVVDLGIHSLPLQRLLDHPNAVGIVVDDKAPTAAHMTNFPAKDSHTDRVKRADGEIAGFRAEQFFNSLLHFAGGFIGESNRQQTRTRDPANADQVGDAAGEHPGLATPGASEHQKRPFRGLHGTQLFGV